MATSIKPLYRRIDLHFVWWSLLVAIVLGTATWLGVPGMTLPMALLSLALVLAIAYVWIMIHVRHRWHCLLTIVVCGVFFLIGWSFWFVFAVHSQIRFLTGYPYPAGGEEVRLVVELVNRGKATSLLHWRARLTDSNGTVYESEPLTISGNSIEIVSADGQKTLYAMPDCDLRFETVRALQTGDAAYGIVDVRFPHYPAGQKISLDDKVELTASDMLGRTISTGDERVSGINLRDVVPCKSVKLP